MLDKRVKTMMVDDSKLVADTIVSICTKIGIAKHDEYSLVRETTEEEMRENPNDPEPVDIKMATLRKALKTEDGGKNEEGKASKIMYHHF